MLRHISFLISLKLVTNVLFFNLIHCFPWLDSTSKCHANLISSLHSFTSLPRMNILQPVASCKNQKSRTARENCPLPGPLPKKCLFKSWDKCNVMMWWWYWHLVVWSTFPSNATWPASVGDWHLWPQWWRLRHGFGMRWMSSRDAFICKNAYHWLRTLPMKEALGYFLGIKSPTTA